MSVQNEILLLFSNVNQPATREQLCGRNLAKQLLLDKAVAFGFIMKDGDNFLFSRGFLTNLIIEKQNEISSKKAELSILKELLHDTEKAVSK